MTKLLWCLLGAVAFAGVMIAATLTALMALMSDNDRGPKGGAA